MQEKILIIAYYFANIDVTTTGSNFKADNI